MAAISGPNIPLDGLVLNIDPASALSYPARNDPFRDQIDLLLDFKGSISDQSKNSITITQYGNATLVSDSTFSTALSLDGNGDYLSIQNSSLFNLGSKDFTIECWIKLSVSQGAYSPIFTRDGTVSNNRYILCLSSSGNGLNFWINASSPALLLSTAINIIDNAWHHVAVVRNGNTFILFLDGVNVSQNTSSVTVPDDTTYPTIGKDMVYYNGLIGPLKFTKGARYTANFNPPRQFNLLPLKIKDIKNDTLGTFTNGPVYSNVQKGAISFDGSDDYIIIPANSNLTFGTADFAIELWFKTSNKTASYPNIIGTNSAWTTNVWSLTDRHASLNPTKLTLHVYNIGNNVLVSNTAIQNNTWYHLVITRIGSNFYMYLNGVLESTYTSSNSFDGGVSNNISVGIANNSTNAYNGSIPYLRVYKNRGFSLKDVLKNYNATRERFVEIPKTISGLQLWLDAADLSTLRQNSNGTTAVALASDPIGYWADKSGNGRNVLQATSSYRPVFAAGAKSLFPGVTFDGVDDFLESTASGATSIVDSTLIMVARWNDVSGTDTPVIVGRGYTGGGEVRAFYRPNGTTKFSWGTWNGDLGTTTIDVSQNTFNIFAATQAGNQIRLYKNYSYNSYTYGNTPASPTYNQWDIGGPNNGYNQYAGITIGEVLIFNKSLTHSEMLVLLAYLNGKWGIV